MQAYRLLAVVFLAPFFAAGFFFFVAPPIVTGVMPNWTGCICGNGAGGGSPATGCTVDNGTWGSWLRPRVYILSRQLMQAH